MMTCKQTALASRDHDYPVGAGDDLLLYPPQVQDLRWFSADRVLSYVQGVDRIDERNARALPDRSGHRPELHGMDVNDIRPPLGYQLDRRRRSVLKRALEQDHVSRLLKS